jgi:HEAT repeat protein
VAIRSSASQEVRRLVADLTEGADQTTRRETAVARLAVIGTRAVRQLLDALASAPSVDARTAVLLALEAIPDPRSIEPVRALLGPGDPTVRIAAARTARPLLGLPQAAPILDRVTAIGIDRQEPGELRIAALDALATLPPRTVKSVWEQLKDDPSPAVRALLKQAGAIVEDPVAELEEAADGWLPRDPHAVLQLVARGAAAAPLSTLHRMVERVRSKESEGRKSRLREWQAVRGALHLALARRGSRVALYDLREAVERASEPLPEDFLVALKLVGDASALEPLAAAYVQSEGIADSEAWRSGLVDAFKAIVTRLGITRRHSAMKRVRSRFREHLGALLAGE